MVESRPVLGRCGGSSAGRAALFGKIGMGAHVISPFEGYSLVVCSRGRVNSNLTFLFFRPSYNLISSTESPTERVLPPQDL
jgi:hypothetical protein